MRFAVVLPWWGYALALAGVLVISWLAYLRVPVPIPGRTRAVLTGLRAITLVAIVVVLLRPVVQVRPVGAQQAIVPVLVDVSRSMRLADGDGPSRIEQARAIVRDLQARLGGDYRVELLTFGETLAPGDIERLSATARRSDVSGALAAVADRHRHDRVASVILLSDGGDNTGPDVEAARPIGVPILAVGIGNPTTGRDREVVNVTAGEPLLAGASIDLSVSAVSTGLGREPIELRVSANGRPVDLRRVIPPADGAPIHAVFTVSPAPEAATVYTVEIPPAPGELAVENNRRSILVPPQTARRRVLLVEGAPGFEHTFLKRALEADPGLDIDAVVRKGQNDDGRSTFVVQAGHARVAGLSGGYPAKRSELFAYDGVIFANVDAGYFTRDQLALTADFVAARGGGLIVMGARSFDRQGLSGTALDEVLPIDSTDRRVTVARASASRADAALNAPSLTADGETHPATRLAASAEESRLRWTQLPALASVAAVGGARPGAQVLAVATAPDGDVRPLLVAQRYGQGRSLVFAGEASWRWRMMRPATDTSYETIWRQMVRWVTVGASGPVSIAPMTPSTPGVTDRVLVTVKDEDFAPVGNAEVTVHVTAPDGQSRQLTPALSSPQDGRYAVAARFDQPGVYRIDAVAAREGVQLGGATRQVLVGGVDLEMSEPRLNEAVLRRIAAGTGGRYLPADQAGALPSLVRNVKVEAAAPDTRDLWDNGWSLLAIVTLLAAEWLIRRQVGLA